MIILAIIELGMVRVFCVLLNLTVVKTVTTVFCPPFGCVVTCGPTSAALGIIASKKGVEAGAPK